MVKKVFFERDGSDDSISYFDFGYYLFRDIAETILWI